MAYYTGFYTDAQITKASFCHFSTIGAIPRQQKQNKTKFLKN